MARDRIAEVALIRQRAGKYKRIPSASDLTSLKAIWNSELKGVAPIDELILIRIITILEVFFRDWIEKLIDHGAPFVERASKLKIDLKYDFAIASSLQGGSVTLGQLIAHSVSLNRIEVFASMFGTLLAEDFFGAISKTRDRWKVRREGGVAGPIIDDMTRVRKTLARLFEVRHILVHEFPEKKPFEAGEIGRFLDDAALFLEASDEELATRLFGDYPLTQSEMNADARKQFEVATEQLAVVCKEAAAETPEISEVQKLWTAFMTAEAERQTQRQLGGSIR
ncbi:MAG: hypothetical protein ACRECC_07650, partial [Pseudolabrys sp.]